MRDTLQIGAENSRLAGPAWARLRAHILRAVAKDMGLRDAHLRLEPLKVLVYGPGRHFAEHADTEKTPGMVASLAVIVPGEYEDGALTIEHARGKLAVAAGRAPKWRWAAWYADRRHRLERVESGVRIAPIFEIVTDPETPLTAHKASSPNLGWALWDRSYAEWHTAWAARGSRVNAGREQYGHRLVWVLSHRYTRRPSNAC